MFRNLLTEVYHSRLIGSGDSHERGFEEILQRYGMCYKRHPNGTHQSPDFEVDKKYSVELKSTKGNRIFLNDSFFVDSRLYIISRKEESIISFGRDLYTTEEKSRYLEYEAELKKLREKYRGGDRLYLYPRSATQYTLKVDREKLWRRVLKVIL